MSIELPVTTRRRRDISERWLKSTLILNNTHFVLMQSQLTANRSCIFWPGVSPRNGLRSIITLAARGCFKIFRLLFGSLSYFHKCFPSSCRIFVVTSNSNPGIDPLDHLATIQSFFIENPLSPTRTSANASRSIPPSCLNNIVSPGRAHKCLSSICYL